MKVYDMSGNELLVPSRASLHVSGCWLAPAFIPPIRGWETGPSQNGQWDLEPNEDDAMDVKHISVSRMFCGPVLPTSSFPLEEYTHPNWREACRLEIVTWPACQIFGKTNPVSSCVS